MTATQFSNAGDFSTAALFRSWGSAISAGLAAVGLIQTADTGQINWTTVSNPGGTNTSMGYEMWRFSDSLQATAPIFIKIEYGSGSLGSTEAAIWITVGTATNGAGTLTTALTARLQFKTLFTGLSGRNYWFSGSTNRFAGAFFEGNTRQFDSNVLFTIERTHDAAGADTSEGVLMTWVNPNTAAGPTYRWQAYIFAVVAAQSLSSGTPSQVNAGDGTSAIDGVNVALFPWSLRSRRGAEFPCRNVATYWAADIPSHNQFTVSHYGINHTFLALGPDIAGQDHAYRKAAISQSAADGSLSAVNDASVAIRYE